MKISNNKGVLNMLPRSNILINVLLKNKDTCLNISYDSVENKSVITPTYTYNSLNEPMSLKNGLKAFDFTKEEINKIKMLDKYNCVNPMYLLHTKEVIIDTQKQMRQYIDELVRNPMASNEPYKETKRTVEIVNPIKCSFENTKFLIELLTKYRKYIAIIYDFNILVKYDNTYVTIECSTNQTIANDKNIDVTVSESTTSNVDGYEKFFNDVSLIRLDSKTDNDIKQPVFRKLFADINDNLLMTVTENKTVDFYKSNEEMTPKTMYNVSLNNSTRKLQKEIRYNYLFVKEYVDKKISNDEHTILGLNTDFQTTNIKNIDPKYYDIIECYPITDESNNIKHITKNDLLDVLNTLMDNLDDIPKFIM